MVATLIAVAEGRITERDVYEMLTIPSKFSFNSRVTVVPPSGLYLVNVEYDDEDKRLIEDECDVEYDVDPLSSEAPQAELARRSIGIMNKRN